MFIIRCTCRKKVRIPESLFERRARCPSCGTIHVVHIIQMPAEAQMPTEAAPAELHEAHETPALAGAMALDHTEPLHVAMAAPAAHDEVNLLDEDLAAPVVTPVNDVDLLGDEERTEHVAHIPADDMLPETVEVDLEHPTAPPPPPFAAHHAEKEDDLVDLFADEPAPVARTETPAMGLDDDDAAAAILNAEEPKAAEVKAPSMSLDDDDAAAALLDDEEPKPARRVETPALSLDDEDDAAAALLDEEPQHAQEAAVPAMSLDDDDAAAALLDEEEPKPARKVETPALSLEDEDEAAAALLDEDDVPAAEPVELDEDEESVASAEPVEAAEPFEEELNDEDVAAALLEDDIPAAEVAEEDDVAAALLDEEEAQPRPRSTKKPPIEDADEEAEADLLDGDEDAAAAAVGEEPQLWSNPKTGALAVLTDSEVAFVTVKKGKSAAATDALEQGEPLDEVLSRFAEKPAKGAGPRHFPLTAVRSIRLSKQRTAIELDLDLDGEDEQASIDLSDIRKRDQLYKALRDRLGAGWKESTAKQRGLFGAGAIVTLQKRDEDE